MALSSSATITYAHILLAGGLGSRNRWKSGELSIAAHAELLAVQLQDNSASAVVADANIATLAGSGNTWHSTGTSSSSQTQITQRLTRLDTAAWQIAYHELKFSRVIGEGSFGYTSPFLLLFLCQYTHTPVVNTSSWFCII